MGKIIYQHNQYAIQEVFTYQKKGYILFNTKKEFQDGHTHLNNLKSAKYLIMLAEKQKLPLDLDLYRLESLIRVLEDGSLRNKALELLDVKKKKETKKYINIHKKYVQC